MTLALADFARRLAALHRDFAAGVDRLCSEFADRTTAPVALGQKGKRAASANGTEASARRHARRGLPPTPPAGSALAEPSMRKRGKVDPEAFKAAWLGHGYDQLQAMFDLSPAGVFWWKKKLGLPNKPKARAAARAARESKPTPHLAWSAPVTDAGAKGVPAPLASCDAKNAIPGLAAAPFDESEPVSIDTVIKFLRQRDMAIGVLPSGEFRIDGRRNVDRDELVRIANRKRALMRKPEFVLEASSGVGAA